MNYSLRSAETADRLPLRHTTARLHELCTCSARRRVPLHGVRHGRCTSVRVRESSTLVRQRGRVRVTRRPPALLVVFAVLCPGVLVRPELVLPRPLQTVQNLVSLHLVTPHSALHVLRRVVKRVDDVVEQHARARKLEVLLHLGNNVRRDVLSRLLLLLTNPLVVDLLGGDEDHTGLVEVLELLQLPPPRVRVHVSLVPDHVTLLGRRDVKLLLHRPARLLDQLLPTVVVSPLGVRHLPLQDQVSRQQVEAAVRVRLNVPLCPVCLPTPRQPNKHAKTPLTGTDLLTRVHALHPRNVRLRLHTTARRLGTVHRRLPLHLRSTLPRRRLLPRRVANPNETVRQLRELRAVAFSEEQTHTTVLRQHMGVQGHTTQPVRNPVRLPKPPPVLAVRDHVRVEVSERRDRVSQRVSLTVVGELVVVRLLCRTSVTETLIVLPQVERRTGRRPTHTAQLTVHHGDRERHLPRLTRVRRPDAGPHVPFDGLAGQIVLQLQVQVLVILVQPHRQITRNVRVRVLGRRRSRVELSAGPLPTGTLSPTEPEIAVIAEPRHC
eukprot:Hpha_TRINITY_DN15065_c5_g7::TRINITY_DN15065_c5_g7_i3::g.125180::m.125180